MKNLPHFWRHTLATLGRIHRRIVVGPGLGDYAGLAILGLLPIAIAWMIDVGDSRTTPESLRKLCQASFVEPVPEIMKGFFQAYDWILYPLMLPAALYIVRMMMGMTFGELKKSPLQEGEEFGAIRHNAQFVLDDGRSIILVLLLNLIIHIIDMWTIVSSLFEGATQCRGDIDWGLYSFYFNDVSTSELGILLIFTTFEQFVLAGLGLLILVNVARFNLCYLNSIYLQAAQPSREYFALNFDDEKQLFGLGKLSLIFNQQLTMLSIIGGFLLISRYNNVNIDLAGDLFYKIVSNLMNLTPSGETKADLGFLSGGLKQLFRDPGQILIPIAWLLLAAFTMLPVQVKHLPFRYVVAKDGRVDYLRQFTKPSSKYAEMLDSNEPNQIDEVARRFKQYSFWPTGDLRAREGIFLAAVVLLLLILPINPFSSRGIIPFLTVLLLSAAATRSFLTLHKYRLRRVDPTLVD